MRRLLFPVLFWTPVVIGAGMVGYGIFTSDMSWVDRGITWGQSGALIYLVLAAKRLLTNWPAGILLSSGFEAGVAWQKKHAKRGRFQVVTGKDRREPPRQSRG